MLSELVETWLFAVQPARLSGEGEVVQARDAAHGVVSAVTFESAVAEDLPSLHAGEDMLDAGPNLLVRCVVGFLPGQVFSLAATVGMTSPMPG